MNRADPCVGDVLDRFLERTGSSANDEAVVDLLRSYLDGYGHQMLSGEEADAFFERYDQDDEGSAFCGWFGPEYVLEGLPEFLGWFVIRKVMAGPELLGAVGPVTDALVAWMVSERIVSEAAADGATELAAAATRDLPAAEELSELLYRSGQEVDHDAVSEYVDWETELAEISRIEGCKLWFRSELGEIGPVIVPERATHIARVGWGVSAPGFGRTQAGWVILEMGNVYPT